MSFLDKTGLQTLTNKLVQGDAIKVASHRGHTVKNVIDNIQRECDNVANPLEYKVENRVAEFKIGKGRDVDVSGDVEEGKVEVELKGKTYQNLINDNKWLHSETKITSSHTNNVSLVATSFLRNKNLMKPSTTYTLILDLNIVLNTLKNSYFQLNCERVDGKQESVVRITNVSYLRSGGLMRVKFTTSDTFFRLAQAFIGGYGGTLTIKSNGMTILEGDHTQTPAEELPQYFEGIKSSFEDGIVDIEVVGKNMLDDFFLYSSSVKIVEETNNYIITEGSGNIGGGIKFTNVKVKPNTYYSFSMTCQAISPTNHDNIVRVWQPNKKEYITVSLCTISNELTRVKGTFKTPPDCDSIIEIWCGKSSHHSEITRFKFIKDWLLEENAIATQYESYYKKKISFNIGEPLRSLPNGVCDEIRNNNGQWELVRKVGKVILNGSESWSQYDSQELENSRYYFLNFNGVKSNNILCNILPTNSPDAGGMWDRDIEGIAYKIGNGCFRLRLSKTKANSLKDFKIWLSQNLATVYYELETPIITPIEPIEFEIKPLGSININSDISPVSYHTVQLNRAGQIERAICNIAELKNRVEALETIYDSHFLETQHKLSLLEMDYELEGGSV